MRKAIRRENNKRYSQDFYLRHKDKKTEYRKSNKKRDQETRQKHQSKLKEIVISHYSDKSMKCQKCGFSDMRALSLDHIDGGGSKHLKEIKTNLYSWVIKNNFPKMFQVLCMNCQWIKRCENNELYGHISDKMIQKYIEEQIGK